MKNIRSKYFFAVAGFAIGILTAFLYFNKFVIESKKIDVHAEKIFDKPAEDEHDHSSEHAEDEHDRSSEHAEDEIVALSNNEMKEFGIVLKTAAPDKIQLHTDLSGEIRADPSKIAHIIPRFSGIVKEIRKTIGDKVKRNEVIAVIESNESLAKYKVVSSIEGTVIDMHMTPGEVTNEESAHDITVANLKTVWAELNVYQKDFSNIRVGQTAIISASYDMHEAEGIISFISPIVNEKTRTATARVALNNSSGRWKPGMFITSKVFTLKKLVPLAVAKNALQTFEGQTVVFVKDKEGFRPQPVIIGIQNSKTVEILSGLHKNQPYIAQGAFIIKSELMKESFGGGHNH